MVLEIISVYFRRNKRLIFHNFNLKLAKSQIIILIGENGVGKSSLFDLSVGILKPEKGVIKINEISINEIDKKKKDLFTYLPHKDSLKDYLTVEENLLNWLELIGSKIQKEKFFNHLKFFKLNDLRNNLIGNLSQGQRKKVSLTKLLLSKCNLWILDEPFNGLDIDSINKTKKMICNHKANGGSVLLASHINLNIEGSKRIFIKNPKLKISNNIANFNTWENIK